MLRFMECKGEEENGETLGEKEKEEKDFGEKATNIGSNQVLDPL